MRVLSLLAGMAAFPVLLAPVPVPAEEAASYVWKAFGGDGEASSLLVLDKSKADDPEAHYKFYLSCTTDEPWTMNVSDIDAKALGAAVAEKAPPSFRLVIDGKAESDDGGFSPDIVFNPTDSVWEYSTNWDLSLLDTLSAASEIGISGTGVEENLPKEGMKEAVAAFKAACEALQATTDEGEKSGEKSRKELY
ncbi:MAG: hypothetical protein ABI399_13830, partial [Bauldia sp.]